MKLQAFLCLVPIALTGCVGYNSTLFTTKSNVGLDLDTKPPTAEISVSRKEVAVAPGFEDGKTPPVMASFVTRSGFAGGFQNFFLGVSQTFSGGDAAVAMSMLYTNETDTNVDLQTYSSARPLTETPIANRSSNWFWRFLFGLPQPGQIRPFIFGTDTSMGLKVAWSGTGGQFPDTVRAGFNRKEFAWAPVFFTPSNSNTGGTMQIPSFVATVDANINGDQGGEVGSVQYFATGSAATHLTRQKNVREALIQRFDPRGEKRAAQFQNFAKNQTNQFDSLEKIVTAYPNASAERQGEILKQAKSAGLVPGTTTTGGFLKAIVKNRDASNAETTLKLRSLAESIGK